MGARDARHRDEGRRQAESRATFATPARRLPWHALPPDRSATSFLGNRGARSARRTHHPAPGRAAGWARRRYRSSRPQSGRGPSVDQRRQRHAALDRRRADRAHPRRAPYGGRAGNADDTRACPLDNLGEHSAIRRVPRRCRPTRRPPAQEVRSRRHSSSVALEGVQKA